MIQFLCYCGRGDCEKLSGELARDWLDFYPRACFNSYCSRGEKYWKRRKLFFLSFTKYIYVESTTVYVPWSERGLPNPLFRKRVCPPPPPIEPGRGGGGVPHSPSGVGLGESQFRRLGKKLSTLATLCCRLTGSNPLPPPPQVFLLCI